MIKPRHSFGSVVRALREGLEDGSISLASQVSSMDQSPAPDASILDVNRRFVELLDRASNEARNMAMAEGLHEGRRISEDEIRKSLRLVRNATLTTQSSFPLRRKTTITVFDSVYFREILIGQETRTLTLTRDIVNAGDLSEYLKTIVSVTAPIETSVQLEP